MSEYANILIVEKHPLVREGLVSLIDVHEDLHVCGATATARRQGDAVDAQPDLVVVGLSMENDEGLRTLREVHSAFPDRPVLVLSMYDERVYASMAMREGARGYLMKQDASAKVVPAIRCLLNGGLYMSDAAKEALVIPPPHPNLEETPEHSSS